MSHTSRFEPMSDGFLIEENVALQAYNTLSVPVSARFFCRALTVKQLNDGLVFANERQLAVLILGEGSNTVFTQDFNGLLILNRLSGIELKSDTAGDVNINVAAGENWHDFVDYCLSQEWFGLENLALIPGLVGASPIQNIGAYGVEVKDTIESVTYLELATGEKRTLTNKECQFAYRDSVFKNRLNGETAIISVEFRLSKKLEVSLAYPALTEQLGLNPSPRDVFDKVCNVRRSKLPMPEDIPNAGSFFKNPVISKAHFERLTADFPGIVGFEFNGGVKLAAAWLIEQRGWKQKEVADVKVHQRQALVVTNPKHKTGQDILLLATAIQADIKAIFNVCLEIEPRIY